MSQTTEKPSRKIAKETVERFIKDVDVTREVNRIRVAKYIKEKKE
jgi:hypothetical protein